MTVTHTGPDTGYEDSEHEHHPSDAMYWKIGGILAILTLLEVGTYFITDDPYSHELAPLLIGGLLALMVIKFFTIASFFMHLKFDNRIFRIVFVTGLVLAVFVYLIVLATFQYFDESYEAGLQLLG